MFKEIITGVITILIVLAAILSLFFTVNEVGARLIQSLATLVIGYYYGVKNFPLSAVFKKKIEGGI